MDNPIAITQLKAMLQREVSSICTYKVNAWNAPIATVLNEIKESNIDAVFFGGTLRTLLLSRLHLQRNGRPRDVDLVVVGTDIHELKQRFKKNLIRETRFGGLQIRLSNWDFDIWPLHQTWAFLRDEVNNPQLSDLPYTTFFNLEAIAVDIKEQGTNQGRTIYSGDEQFFRGILTKTLEINRIDNPFPALCVVRAFVLVLSTKFSIGPRLTHYLVTTGPTLTDDELFESQMAHYGQIYGSVKQIREWLDKVRLVADQNRCSRILVTDNSDMVYRSTPKIA